MKSRPILFSAEMIRALLDGRKTQTRRIVKPQPQLSSHHEPVRAELRGDRRWVFMTHTDRPDYGWATGDVLCPFGVPGDLLWARETHAIVGNIDPGWVLYRASGYENECRRHGFDRPVPGESEIYKPIGTERLSKDGYLERKINDNLPLRARWKFVHLIVWEAEHGPVPPGHAVAFMPGRKTNKAAEITVDALELVSRRDLMLRNSIHNLPEALVEIVRLRGALKRQINKRVSDGQHDR
ncbi:MAG TPA: HNH endonuclease [Steroidobacter sp.]|uniref:HNH endonuclease n=1 Tax=Steroidobacter sp. TaxID=1978227 RepID=UPI002EDA4CB0